MKRRYFLTEKAKDAQVIGILVATLAVSNYLNLISKLELLIKKAGKKPYVIVVGKINEAKLANFELIDMFVIVACHENTLFDSKDFFKPIITPYELFLALARGQQWTGEYSNEFIELLPKLENCLSQACACDQDQAEVHFSLVSQSLTAIPSDDSPKASNEIAERNQQTSVIQFSPAGQYLAHREYKGLEPSIGNVPVASVTKGRSGVPIQYDEE